MAKRAIFLRTVAVLLLICLCLPLFSCAKERGEDSRIKIVCTLFVQYDWLKNIVGESERVDLSLLIDNGTDLHSYQPTAADIMEISDCDMIVYLGSDIDTWVAEAIERAENSSLRRVALTECEGITLKNISSESEHGGHDHSEHGGHDHSEHDGHDHGALDEHVWLSLKNAALICKALCEELCALDPDGAEEYRKNTAEYVASLAALDAEYASAVASVAEDKRFMLFCDRFPFIYLLEDYGIDYAAAFEGCSTDVDADFATVLRLIEEADAHMLDCIIVTESSDRALANTVASSSKRGVSRVLVMDSLQAVGKGRIARGESYLSVMKKNLSVLESALGINDQEN